MLEYLLLTVITIVLLFILITLEPTPTTDLEESNLIVLVSYFVCFVILAPILIIFFIITKLLRDD